MTDIKPSKPIYRVNDEVEKPFYYVGEADAWHNWHKESDRKRIIWLVKCFDEVDEERNLLRDKIKKVAEWAYNMGLMYEDCAFLSHSASEEAAKNALAELVELVGPWVPPEIREEKEVSD